MWWSGVVIGDGWAMEMVLSCSGVFILIVRKSSVFIIPSPGERERWMEAADSGSSKNAQGLRGKEKGKFSFPPSFFLEMIG